MYRLTTKVPPASEPLTLEEAKDYLAITADDKTHDGPLSRMIVSARNIAESHTNRGILSQQWVLERSGFDPIMYLPGGEFQQIDAFEYVDAAGDTQSSFNDYRVLGAEPAEIWLTKDAPEVQDGPGSVIITYTLGWTAREAVPAALKDGMLAVVKVLWDAAPFGNFPLGAEGEVFKHLFTQYKVGDEFTVYG